MRAIFPDGDHGDECGLGFLRVGTGAELFSYANTAERGITGSNRLMRHNFNLRTTTGLFRQRLKLDGNISFMRQVVEDKPVPGGFYMNPLVGLYRFPAGGHHALPGAFRGL